MGVRVLWIVMTIFLFTVSSSSISPDHRSSDEMVLVRGGTFRMGEEIEKIVGNEDPLHRVKVDSFYIGKFEVTQAEWAAVMGSNPSLYKGDHLPVAVVSWYDVVGYCNKRSRLEGLTPCYKGTGDVVTCDFSADGYRLPSEAEWEYACRGGQESRHYNYSGSNDPDEVAWYGENGGDRAHPVGQKKPNELGIFDMSGNVWEWCWDRYDPGYYRESPDHNPRGPAAGQQRVYRGGGGGHYLWLRISGRYSFNPQQEHWFVGFRVVRSDSGRPLKGRNNSMIFVRGGTFMMGSVDGVTGEKPAHNVTVNSFYMGKYEVTQEQWTAVMKNNPSFVPGARCPVQGVSWYDTVEYCNRRSRLEGLTPCYSGSKEHIRCNFEADGYRLPSEAEWEYACRGGLQSRHYTYSGSNDPDEVAWHAGNSWRSPQPVGLKKPNELGIYDMSGNVYEWCWDGYDFYFYGREQSRQPRGPSATGWPHRVMRGGTYWFPENYLRNTFRFYDEPFRAYSISGFRVVRTVK